MKLVNLLGTSALLVLARPAGACGVTPSHYTLLGQPVDSQIDVPTDVVPVYDGTELGAHSTAWTNEVMPGGAAIAPLSFTLRTSTGEVVPISVERAGAWHVALHPSAPLEPNTSYVVEARRAGYLDGPPVFDLTLAFTTGAGPLPAEALPALASASLQYWWSENGGNSAACDFWGSGACVAVPAGDLLQVQYVSSTGEVSDPFLHDGPFESDVPRERLSSDGMCIEVRRRAPNGVLGESTVTCEAARPEARLPGAAQPSCTEAGVAGRDWDASGVPFTIEVADLIPPDSSVALHADTQPSTSGTPLDSDVIVEAGGCNMTRSSALAAGVPLAGLVAGLCVWRRGRRK